MRAWILRNTRTEYGKRIRKAYESHEISEKRGNMNTMEPRTDGISNTLTTVQKDNMLLEARGGIAMQHNDSVIWGGLQEHQHPRDDGISPALTAAMGMGGGQTPIFTERSKEMSKVGQISSEGSQCGSVFSDDGNMATLSAGTHGYANAHICTEYRIRKLTPRECWRLMSFTDEDFDRAESVNSNTQLYKQAGNSIVKNVLVAIFGQMIPGKENVYREENNREEV